MSPRLSTGAFSSFPSTLLSHPARRTLSYRLKGCALSCFGLKHKISCFLVCLPSPTHVTPQSVLRGSTHLSVALKAFLTPQGWVRAIPTGTSVSLVLGAGRLRSPCAVGLKAPAGLVHSPQGKWTEGTLCWRLAQGASQAAQWFKKKTNLLVDAGDTGSVPWVGRSPGRETGNPLQYSCLENSIDREACWATSTGSQRVGHDWVNTHARLAQGLHTAAVRVVTSISSPSPSESKKDEFGRTLLGPETRSAERDRKPWITPFCIPGH